MVKIKPYYFPVFESLWLETIVTEWKEGRKGSVVLVGSSMVLAPPLSFPKFQDDRAQSMPGF